MPSISANFHTSSVSFTLKPSAGRSNSLSEKQWGSLLVLPARLGAGSAVRPAPLFSLDRWRVSNATEIARNRLSEQGVGRAESRDQALFSTLLWQNRQEEIRRSSSSCQRKKVFAFHREQSDSFFNHGNHVVHGRHQRTPDYRSCMGYHTIRI